MDEAISLRNKNAFFNIENSALQKVVDLLHQHIEEYDLMEVKELEEEYTENDHDGNETVMEKIMEKTPASSPNIRKFRNPSSWWSFGYV